MRDIFIQFLTDESGGGALEFALVSSLAIFASVAAIFAVHGNENAILPALQKQITNGVDQISRALR